MKSKSSYSPWRSERSLGWTQNRTKPERIGNRNCSRLSIYEARDAETLRVWGTRLHEFANGIDNNEVIEEYEAKSVGRDTTFEKDVDDEEQILRVLDELAEQVHEDAIAIGYKFKTITVRVQYQHFDTYTRSKSLLFPTNDLDILKNNAKRLIAPFLRGNRKVRLIGVRVSNLISTSRLGSELNAE